MLLHLLNRWSVVRNCLFVYKIQPMCRGRGGRGGWAPVHDVGWLLPYHVQIKIVKCFNLYRLQKSNSNRLDKRVLIDSTGRQTDIRTHHWSKKTRQEISFMLDKILAKSNIAIWKEGKLYSYLRKSVYHSLSVCYWNASNKWKIKNKIKFLWKVSQHKNEKHQL